MATYYEISKYVRKHFGFVPADCWIAHTKALNGLPVRRAWNRTGRPVPRDKQPAIEKALRHFRML